MRRICIFIASLLLSINSITAQVVEKKDWCNLTCDLSEEDLLMVKDVYQKVRLFPDSMKYDFSPVHFPIRFLFVQKDSNNTTPVEQEAEWTIQNLNYSFTNVGFTFSVESVHQIISHLTIEDLSLNAYNIYDEFSQQHDKEDIISIYVLDHAEEFCDVQPTSIRCGRTGGFSYILSDRTNNVVMSRFDLKDLKVVAHEMGHFFGLYHTFEEHQFGKDNFSPTQCHLTGDRICDTPPDPGAVFEVYVNYSNCEMAGMMDAEGNEYKPLIENYMAYYKPCYLKEYSFTDDQIQIMRLAAHCPLRKKFRR